MKVNLEFNFVNLIILKFNLNVGFVITKNQFISNTRHSVVYKYIINLVTVCVHVTHFILLHNVCST